MTYTGLKERQHTTTQEEWGSFGKGFGESEKEKPEEKDLTGKLTATKLRQRPEPTTLEKRILVADDDVAYREALGRGLQGHHTTTCSLTEDDRIVDERTIEYRVDYASNADELIQKARTGSYYAIVTDNNMNDSYQNSGLYAIAEIRKRCIKTPIVFTTADMTKEKESIARSLGATDVMKKPIMIADLIKVLDGYARR